MNESSGAVSVKADGRPIQVELMAVGIIGGDTLVLKDASGMLELKFPIKLWPFIQPGDIVFTTISPIKVTVEPVMSPLPGLDPGFKI